ncbi:MAG: hypothetical protein H0V45_07875 [Actinobacteria bacterium]|nr:hypothetical protein [Actinomycetota bacterium]
MAATWRAVGEAAESLGIRRPSYDKVRRLARIERARQQRAGAARRAAIDAVLAFTSPHVVEFAVALDRLRDAQGDERLVTQQHKLTHDP